MLLLFDVSYVGFHLQNHIFKKCKGKTEKCIQEYIKENQAENSTGIA